MESLIDAIAENNATLGFDATGGGNEGKLAGQILLWKLLQIEI